MNEDYFNRRIKGLVDGGEFLRVDIEKGAPNFIGLMFKETRGSVPEDVIRRRGLAERYTARFHYGKNGQEQVFPVSVKVYQDTSRYDHRLPKGVTIDAYTEFVYRALREMGCESFFDEFYDRFPQERAVVTEHVDWPTAFQVIDPLINKIHKKYGETPPKVIYVPEIEETYSEIEKLLAAVIDTLAGFHVFSSRLLHRIKPMKLPVFLDGKLEEREVYFFEETEEHLLEQSVRFLKKLRPEVSKEEQEKFRDMYRVIVKMVAGKRGKRHVAHSDISTLNIAVNKGNDGDYEAKLLDVEHMSLRTEVGDLSALVSDMLVTHFIYMKNESEKVHDYWENFLKFYLVRRQAYEECCDRMDAEMKGGEK
jgi:hypothetical protein